MPNKSIPVLALLVPGEEFPHVLMIASSKDRPLGQGVEDNRIRRLIAAR